MLFSFWYRALRSCVHQGRSEKRRKPPQRQRARKPWVEVLEDRVAPAVLTVNTLADDIAADNFLSLREAIAVVNSGSTSGLSAAERAQITGSPGSNDTVRFDHSLLGSTQATLALGGGELQLLRDVMIAGPGADRLAISANGRGRVFSIDSTVTASLAGLTIENGYDSIGGGIYSLGSLTVSYCTFAGNSAQGEGGAIDSPDTYTGRLSVANSSFTDNTAGSYGGAISSASTLIVSDTKFSGNSSGLQGGGIYNLGSRIGQEGSLTNVTFTNNQSHWGGAIDNEGVLTVDNSTFSGNTSTADGGAIHNVGTLTVEDNSSFTGNATNVDGGGIANDGQGTLIVSDSSFSGNSAGAGYGYGGGIFNDEYGTLSVSSTVFSNNRAYDGGGIDSWGGDVTVVDSTFSTNTATNNGGGIYNALYTPDTLTVQGGSFTDNAANGGSGGGIYSDGTLILSGTTFSGNYSVSGGSAIANGGTGSSVLLATFSGENLSDSSGAGIANGGTLTINYSTFSDCYADNGGAIANSGTLGVSNSTFAANTAVFWGGAILNGDRGTLTVTNSTLWRNSTTSPFGDGGGIANYGTLTVINSTLSGNSSINGGSGGGIYNSTGGTYSTGTLTLENTIVAGNAAAAGIGPDVYGSVDPGSGFNLIGDGAGMSGISNGDANSNQVGFSGSPIDPGLDPAGLQNNGPGPGSMLTIALVAGSPAIDKGTTTTDLETGQPLTTDQRGLYRSVGAAPDIGAYEYQPPDTTTTLSVSPADSTMVYAGQPVVLTATVRGDAANSNTPTGSVDFADTTTGTDLGSASLVNGVAILATASLPAGPHSLTATYSGFTQGSYQFAGSASSPVNETIAALPSDVSGAGSGIIQANGTPTTTASAAADNQSVGATLSLGTSGQAAGVWVADYTGNPTNPASGNIRIRNSTVSSQGLAYYDVRSSNVSSANTAATLQVTFTLRVASSQVAGLVVAYFDPVAGWSTVNAPSTETLLNNGDGTDNVTITLALSSGTTPAISTLTGTVFVAAFTPTLDYWTNPAGGEWDDAGNWSAGVPGPTDAAIIDIPGQNTFTVTHSAGTDFVYSLTSADALVVSGGTLSITAASAINGAFTIGGALNGTGSLTVTGPLTLEPTATVSNAGGLVADGGATFSTDPVRGGPELERTTLTLHGTSTASPQYWGISVIDGGRLVVAADGTLDVLTSGNLSTSGQGAGYLDNYGRIETHGSGTTTFGMTVTNEPGAVIQADAGTLALGDGDANYYSGRIVGEAGSVVQFYGGFGQEIDGAVNADQVVFTNWPSASDTTVAGSFFAGSTTITYATVHFTGDAPHVGALTVYLGTADFSPAGDTAATLTLDSLSLYGNLMGTDSFVVAGSFTWTGGRLVGPVGSGLTALAGMTLSPAPPSSYIEIDGRTLINPAGQTASFTGGDLFLYEGARLVNQAGALLDLVHGGYIGDNLDGNASLDNAGTIQAQSGGTVQLPLTNEPSALIQADAGTLVLVGRSTYDGTIRQDPNGPGASVEFDYAESFAPTSSVNFNAVTFDNRNDSGTTTVAGSFFAGSTTITYATVHFTGDAPHVGALTLTNYGNNPGYNVADFSPASGPATLTLDSLALAGELAGTDSFVVEGSFTWTGGRLAGPAGSSLTALAGMTLSPAAWNFGLDGRALINPAGQTAFFTGGYWSVYDGAEIDNEGNWEVTGSGVLNDPPGNSGPPALFANDKGGTIDVAVVGGGQVAFDLAFDNNGSITVQAGNTFTMGGGTSSGSFYGVPGSVLSLGGDFTPSSSITGDQVIISGTVAGSYAASTSTSVTWGATFTGSVASVGALSVSEATVDFSPVGQSSVTLDSLDMEHANLTGSADVYVVGLTHLGGWGSSMEGTGTTYAEGGLVYDNTPDSYLLRRLVNEGQALWDNSTVQIEANGTFVNAAGATMVAQGADDWPGYYGTSATFENQGTFVVQGDATQVSFGVPFDNSGTVQIDGGNLSLGLLNEEISGPDQYGQVTVNSSFTLGSALQVSLVNGYAPLSGDTFTIVHPQGTATVTGTFAGLPEGGWLHTATGALQITYQGGAGQDVVLKAFSTQVVNTSDSGPGSLRQAILDANAIPGTDTITFAIPTTDTGYDAGTYTITLASALPALSGDVAISGAGAAQVAISGAGLYQILNVNAGVTASISGLTFEDGAGGEGGAIFNAGNLTLADCALTNNRAGYDGGGIYNDAGTLTMDGDTLTSNSAQNGGAVYNSGGVLAMDGDTFEANPAFNGGGVFIDSGSVTVTTCTFQQNQATTGAGGGIFFNSGTLTVVGSTLSANSAPGYDGGALFVVNGPVSVVNSTFSGNSALFGGGIWSYSAASFTIAGSTFSGNSQTGAGYAAGITNYSGLITLTNSIVANSMGGADLGGYAPFSGSYDLIGDGSNLGELANSLQGNPLLAGLGNYGGSTQTMALLPGSPAINAGTSAGAPVTDQRGYGRVGAVDIGAFESQGFTLRISGGDNQDATVDNPFASPLAVQVTARNPLEPVDGGQVAFTVPGSGASAILSTGDAAISGGKVSVMATANGIGGGYVVSATATGASGVLFSLTNDKATVTTMITSSVNPAVFGQAVTFTASVSAIPPGVPTPTGSVDFVDTTTNTDLGTVSLSGGSASVTISALTAGTHVIEAVYEGNDTYLSSSGTVAQAVNPATPTVSVNAVNLTYGTALANSQLSGTATWIVGSNPVTVAGTFTYTNAAGTILNAGNGQSEAVTFTPTDSTDYTTAPTTVIVNVTKATPTVQVTDAGGTYNQLPFAATATVMGVSGVAGPSLEGVAPTVVYSNASGTQLSGAPVLPGTYTAMATFAGSTDYNTAVSSTVTFTIKTPTTSITGPTIGVPGQPLTYTFAVNGPTQGLTFSINYGDGTSLTTSAGGPTIKLDHLYTATGSFTIQVTATDPNNVTSQLATQTVTIATVEMETDPSGGTALAVGGSAAGRDTITVSATDATGKKLDVKVNKTDYGAFTPTGHILVYGQGGKDTITLKPYVVGNSTYYYIQVPAFLYGEGSGSDKISAAGSAANNVLSGHGNNENLTGGHGRDLLIGGTGSATLNAGTKDDLLIGGWTNYDIFNNTGLNSGTTYDQKLATLDAVMAEWGSSDSYATRLRVLSSSLNTSTVHESSVNGVPVMDSLYGNANTHDWFFASLSDQQNKRVMGTNKDGTDVITTVS